MSYYHCIWVCYISYHVEVIVFLLYTLHPLSWITFSPGSKHYLCSSKKCKYMVFIWHRSATNDPIDVFSFDYSSNTLSKYPTTELWSIPCHIRLLCECKSFYIWKLVLLITTIHLLYVSSFLYLFFCFYFL